MDGDRGADDDGQQSVSEPVSEYSSDSPGSPESASSASAESTPSTGPSVSTDPAAATGPSVSTDPAAAAGPVGGEVASEFVVGLFARLDAVVEDLAQVRYPAMAPGEVRAAVRGLYARVGRVQAQALRSLAALDARDDVVATARPGKAGATFAQHALGLGPSRAAREAGTGRLLDRDGGDLKTVGAALAAGLIGRDKVEVCVSAHAALGARVRDEVDTLLGVTGRRIDLVDGLLAGKAVHLSTPELATFAAGLVAELNPKTPAGGHERRFLHLSQDQNGTWLGRFAAGPGQGDLIRAVIAAGAAPRPGIGIDRDGVRHDLRDDRDLGQRQIDALADALAAAATHTGLPLPPYPGPDPEPWPHPWLNTHTADDTDHTLDGSDTDAAVDEADHAAGDVEDDALVTEGADSADIEEAADTGEDADADAAGDTASHPMHAGDPTDTSDGESEEPPPDGEGEEPPDGEGEDMIVRQPGVLAGPYPPIEIVITVGIEHLAAALARPQSEGEHRWSQDPLNGQSAGDPPRDPTDDPPGDPTGDPVGQETPETPDTLETLEGPLAAALRRARGQAHAQHAPGRPVHPAALRLLTCTAAFRRAVLTPAGAVLDLGRAARLATGTQRRALTARDRTCVIPGCTIPAASCQAHHVTPWAHGGPTDLHNLVMVCARHHADLDATDPTTTWQIVMIDGIPWVRPPTWIDRTRPLLRNAVHQTPSVETP
jgi:hypothetical protein